MTLLMVKSELDGRKVSTEMNDQLNRLACRVLPGWLKMRIWRRLQYSGVSGLAHGPKVTKIYVSSPNGFGEWVAYAMTSDLR